MMRLVPLLMILVSTASAMVLGDSRVLSQAVMEELGVQIEVAELPGPKDARRIWITATVRPLDPGRKFRYLGYSILEKKLDADFESTDAKKAGIRDAKKWAKEIRGEISDKSSLRFPISEGEIPYGYIVVHFNLPPKDGIGVFGTYYLPLRAIERAPKPSPAPTDASNRGAP
jgi:hypothetical protein